MYQISQFVYFKSIWSKTWSDLGTQIRSEPYPDLGTTCFFSDHRTIILYETNGVNNVVCCKRQYSSVLPLLRQCLPNFDGICGTAINYIFSIQVTLIKIANTPHGRSAAIVLSLINRMYWNDTCICQFRQIRLEIWLELDLDWFLKNGRIPDFPESEQNLVQHSNNRGFNDVSCTYCISVLYLDCFYSRQRVFNSVYCCRYNYVYACFCSPVWFWNFILFPRSFVSYHLFMILTGAQLVCDSEVKWSV